MLVAARHHSHSCVRTSLVVEAGALLSVWRPEEQLDLPQTGAIEGMIAVHGADGDASAYCEKLWAVARKSNRDVLLAVPQFTSDGFKNLSAYQEAASKNELVWRYPPLSEDIGAVIDQDPTEWWHLGGNSTTWKNLPNSATSQSSISAYAVMDSLILEVASTNPTLQQLALVGGGEGAQMIQHYASATRVESLLPSPSLSLHYVVTDPGRVIYLNGKRPVLEHHHHHHHHQNHNHHHQNPHRSDACALKCTTSRCVEESGYETAKEDLPALFQLNWTFTKLTDTQRAACPSYNMWGTGHGLDGVLPDYVKAADTDRDARLARYCAKRITFLAGSRYVPTQRTSCAAMLTGRCRLEMMLGYRAHEDLMLGACPAHVYALLDSSRHTAWYTDPAFWLAIWPDDGGALPPALLKVCRRSDGSQCHVFGVQGLGRL